MKYTTLETNIALPADKMYQYTKQSQELSTDGSQCSTPDSHIEHENKQGIQYPVYGHGK